MYILLSLRAAHNRPVFRPYTIRIHHTAQHTNMRYFRRCIRNTMTKHSLRNIRSHSANGQSRGMQFVFVCLPPSKFQLRVCVCCTLTVFLRLNELSILPIVIGEVSGASYAIAFVARCTLCALRSIFIFDQSDILSVLNFGKVKIELAPNARVNGRNANEMSTHVRYSVSMSCSDTMPFPITSFLRLFHLTRSHCLSLCRFDKS